MKTLVPKSRTVQTIGCWPFKAFEVGQRLCSSERALDILAHGSPRRWLEYESLAPEILEQTIPNRAVRRRRRFEMTHIHAEVIQQAVSIPVPDMGQ